MAGEKKGKVRAIGVWNWLGTLLLMAIPGVNLIAAVCFLLFSGSRSKRNFCIAWLLLLVLLAVLAFAALLVFAPQLAELAARLRGAVAPAPGTL